jgi:hypothetical protein
VIGGVLAGIGVVVGVVLIVVGAVAVASINPADFPRVRANHSLRVDFEHDGGYVAYYESDSVRDATDSDVEVPSFSLSITDPNGHRVPTNDYSSALTYSRDGHHGIAARTFHIDDPGVYTFKVGSLPDSDGRVAFGKSTAGATVGGVVLILAGVFGGGFLVLVGVIVLVVTAVRRHRHRNRVAAAGGGYGPPPGAYGHGSPTGQPPPAQPGWAAPQVQPPPFPPAPQTPAPPPPPGQSTPPAPPPPTDPNVPPPLPPPGAPGA